MQEHQDPLGAFSSWGELYELERKQRKDAFFRVGLALSVLLAVTVVMQYAVMAVVVKLFPHAANAWWLNWVLSLVPLYGFGLPAFWLVIKGIEKRDKNAMYVSLGYALPKPAFGVKDFLILTVIGAGLLYIGNFIGTVLMEMLSAAVGYDYQNALTNVMDTSPPWIVVLGTVVIAPWGEELIFRKLLMDRTRGFGDGIAILVSAVAFGLFHGNLFQFFYAFFVGLILAYIYAWSGQWLWCVGMHAIINLFGGVIMPYVTRSLRLEGDPLTDPSLAVDYAIVMGLGMVIWGLMAASVGLIIYLLKAHRVYLGADKGEISLSVEDSVTSVLGNWGMLLAVILYVMYIAVGLLPLQN